MTIEEIFDYVDEVKPNNYSKEIKTHWLNELEGKIQNEIMLLAQPEYISYVYRSSTELSGLSFPNDHTLLLPRRIKAHVGGELELNGLTLYAANNLKGLEILSISSDGKHLSFAEGSFTATGSAGDSGTLMFDGSATTPLIKFPFDRIYASWLIMKVSEHLEESSQFANSAAQFRDDWNGFAAWYADTYRPADGVPTFKGYYLVGKQGDPGLPGKDGSDGITPMIGENGNWYFGEADTGKPSRGVPGGKGDKGDPGAAATIEIGSVTTVDAGTDAEVSNSGTQGAALFNFKIPKGEKGDPGEPALMLYGTVLANNEIVFDPLPGGQAPFSAATEAYIAGRVVQIDVTNPAGDWNTILILSRVDAIGDIQFFNYEKTEYDEEQRLQLVKMSRDGSATYSYIEVPTNTSQLTNDSGYLTLATLPKYGGESE